MRRKQEPHYIVSLPELNTTLTLGVDFKNGDYPTIAVMFINGTNVKIVNVIQGEAAYDIYNTLIGKGEK